jgi:hypothetical protein
MIAMILLSIAFNAMYIVSSMFKDMMRLRIALMIAIILELIYSLNIEDENILINVAFSGLWIAVNTVQIIMILHVKMNLKFTEGEKLIHQTAFKQLSELDFKKLIKEAEWKTYKNHDVLIYEGTVINNLMVVCDGLIEVEAGGKKIAQLRNGSFVGEMSFISGDLTSANVYAVTETKIISWNKDKLKKLLQNNAELQLGMQSVLNTDLTLKLKQTDKSYTKKKDDL